MRRVLMLLGLLSAAVAAYGQGPHGGPGGPHEEGFWEDDGLPPGAPPPMVELPEDLQAMRDELVEGRRELGSRRRDFVREYLRSNQRATRTEALAAFRKEHATDIQSLRNQAQELREAIEDYLPEARREMEAKLSPEAKAAGKRLRDAALEVAEARDAFIDDYLEQNPDAGARDLRQALRTWHDSPEAQELMAARDAAADEFHRLGGPEFPRGRGRAGLPGQRDAFRDNLEESRELQQQFRRQMDAADTADERQAVVERYKEESRRLAEERRAARSPGNDREKN